MSDEHKSTRRQVLMGAVGAAAAGVGGYALYKMTTETPPANPSALDLSRYRKIDPSHFLYAEDRARRVTVDMTHPRAITVDSRGRVFVAGKGDTQIELPYAAQGEITSLHLPGGEPMCLAVSNDIVYIGRKDRVQVFSLEAFDHLQWASRGDRARFTSIAVGGRDVFVADASNREVLRYNRAGKLIGQIGRDNTKNSKGPFVVPSPYFALAIAPDGNLYIANPGMHRVERWTPGGKYLGAWGSAGTDLEKFCGCCNPVDFAMLPDGGFVTVEKGLTRVKTYDANGRFLGVVAGPEQFARHDTICKAHRAGCNAGGLAVATGPDGAVYVLDPYTAEVRVFVRKDSADA